MLALIQITPDTNLALPLGVICTLLSLLIAVTWRLANYVRDVRDELRSTWSFRDQEQWALQLERENRHRNITLYVPAVKRAPDVERE